MSTFKIGDTVRLEGTLTLCLPRISATMENRKLTVKSDYFTQTTDLLITNLFILPEEVDPEQAAPLMATVIDPTTLMSATISTDYLKPVSRPIQQDNYSSPDAKCVTDDDEDEYTPYDGHHNPGNFQLGEDNGHPVVTRWNPWLLGMKPAVSSTMTMMRRMTDMKVSSDTGYTWYESGERKIVSKVRKELIGVIFLDVGDVCDVVMDLNNECGTIVVRTPRQCNLMLLGNEYQEAQSNKTPAVGTVIESAITKGTETGIAYLRVGDKMVVTRVLPNNAILAKHPNHSMDIYLEPGDYKVPTPEPDKENPIGDMMENILLRRRITALYDSIFDGSISDTKLRLPQPVVMVDYRQGSLIMQANPSTRTITIQRV